MLASFQQQPKLSIWYSVMVTLGIIYGTKELNLEKRRELDAAKREEGLLEFSAKLSKLFQKTQVPPVATLNKVVESSEELNAEQTEDEGRS